MRFGNRIKLILLLSVFMSLGTPVFAQDSQLGFYLNGGLDFPKMDDVNNIYQKGLEGYKDVNLAYDLSAGILWGLSSNLSLNIGFNFIFHLQKPPVELIDMKGDTVTGHIKYMISAYNPYLGIRYNGKVGANYSYSVGTDLIYSFSKLSDDLEEADTFFDYLKGSGFGVAVEGNVFRSITQNIGAGVALGYRLLNITQLKIDSSQYEDQSRDVVFTLEGETIDLDFSGPFVKLLFVYKL